MLDVEDFDAVFQGLSYTDGLVQKIQEYQHALGGQTFFERLLELLKIKGRKAYPPKTPQQLHDLHQRIVSSETTLHNKHCLIFYLLKDLSPQHHEDDELATAFARDVHLEKRFWTFIEGLWALDHLEFAIAVGNLTHPSIIPTFPDEIIFTLLTCREKLGRLNVQHGEQDDVLPLAYYNCVTPPLEDQRVRYEFARYLARRNVTETYAWIHTRPLHEQQPLLEILIEQTLEKSVWNSGVGEEVYTREEKAMELVSLPFSAEEEDAVEKFLTTGGGRTFRNAEDTVMMRRIAMGRLVDVADDQSTRGQRMEGVDWDALKGGVKRGLGPRRDEDGFAF
ncbi:nuclear pore complex assembly-domain-containing protein [Boeremia exigua]|uniref:nuclear pore complex assembly-domain-containing protein n=1 Tax=Boeremia exigua TaxID=749465 RepID=UPI001E8CB8E4|nr:nuclear pore complex assembly-domain-containing protein [Boeremia exigua]KAH6637556.1 nuclear pore complex assembly-domain-containing protein [Boeremia exigua]